MITTLNPTEVLNERMAEQPQLIIDNMLPILDCDIIITNLLSDEMQFLLVIISHQSPRRININYYDGLKKAERMLKLSIANN